MVSVFMFLFPHRFVISMLVDWLCDLVASPRFQVLLVYCAVVYVGKLTANINLLM